jgi:hypothetical protein
MSQYESRAKMSLATIYRPMRTYPRSAERSGKPASRSCILPFGPATPTVTPFVLTLSLKMSSASAIFPAQPLGEPPASHLHVAFTIGLASHVFLRRNSSPGRRRLAADVRPVLFGCGSAVTQLRCTLFTSRSPAGRAVRLGHPTAPDAVPRPGGNGGGWARAGRCYWPGGARGGPGGAGRCYWPASSRQVRPLRTLAGRSATMSDPGRAAPSRTLTRIQRRSPVRVSA